MENLIIYSFGIIAGLLICYVVLKKINKNGKVRTDYDERQKVVRGKAYTWGFYGIVIANAILMLLSSVDGVIKMLGFSAFFIPIFVGIVVQISYSIFKDGYVGQNTNMTKYIIFMTLVSIINIGFGIYEIVDNTMMVDGVLQNGFLNLLCGALFIIMAIELIIKKVIDKRGE